MSTKIKNFIVWDIMGVVCLMSMKDATCSSETSLDFQRTSLSHIPVKPFIITDVRTLYPKIVNNFLFTCLEGNLERFL
jgi:hypothetical protein